MVGRARYEFASIIQVPTRKTECLLLVGSMKAFSIKFTCTVGLGYTALGQTCPRAIIESQAVYAMRHS